MDAQLGVCGLCQYEDVLLVISNYGCLGFLGNMSWAAANLWGGHGAHGGEVDIQLPYVIRGHETIRTPDFMGP